MNIVTSDPVARYLSIRGVKGAVSLRLRPMTPTGVLDASLRLYQRLGITFLRHSIVPTLLCVASVAFLQNYVLPEFIAGTATEFTSYIGELVAGLVLAVFVGGPIFLTGMSYTTAMVVSMVSDDMVGNPASAEGAQEVALKAMPRLLLTAIRELVFSLSGVLVATLIMVMGMWIERHTPQDDAWAGVVAGVGLLALVAGGFVFLAILGKDAAVAPAVVLEGMSAKEAGKRSKTLLGKDKVHGVGTRAVWNGYILIAFIGSVLLGSLATALSLSGIDAWVGHLLAGSLLRPLVMQILGLIPPFLTIWLVLPLWATIVTVTYFDRRIRLEGFDVEVLSRNIASNSQSGRYQL